MQTSMTTGQLVYQHAGSASVFVCGRVCAGEEEGMNQYNNSSVPLCLEEGVSRNSVTVEQWQFHPAFQYGAPIVGTVALLFFTAGSLLNVFILLAMLKNRLLLLPAQVLLFSLTVCDLLFLLTLMPFHIVSGFAGEYVFGSSDYVRCQVCQLGITFTTFILASLHTLAILSLDRLIFLLFPLRYKKHVTVCRTVALVTMVWIVCVILSLPPLWGFGEVRLSVSVGGCYPSFYAVTYVLVLLVEALLPIGVLVVSNVGLLWLVKRHIVKHFKMRKTVHVTVSESRDSTAAMEMESSRKTKKQQQLQLVKVFGAIFIVNLIAFLPTLSLGFAAVSLTDYPSEAIAVAYFALISTTVVHPVIEALFVRELRELLVQAVCCTCVCACRKSTRSQ